MQGKNDKCWTRCSHLNKLQSCIPAGGICQIQAGTGDGQQLTAGEGVLLTSRRMCGNRLEQRCSVLWQELLQGLKMLRSRCGFHLCTCTACGRSCLPLGARLLLRSPTS
jgi:hypothetical protein